MIPLLYGITISLCRKQEKNPHISVRGSEGRVLNYLSYYEVAQACDNKARGDYLSRVLVKAKALLVKVNSRANEVDSGDYD